MRLSVVVTVVDAGATLERTLRALLCQEQAPDLEILVPWDATIPDVGAMATRFTGVRFLPMGSVGSRRSPSSPAASHELFDRRRSAGLSAASGAIVAILEDRGAPRPTWARAVVDAHAQWPDAAIGGAIENAVDEPLARAVYFCDFGRYQLPFDSAVRPYLSDVNVSYKRRAIDATAHLWRERYHEPVVHWALSSAGETLRIVPDAIVDQHRPHLTLGPLLAERFHWGRLFGSLRARASSGPRRFVRLLATPLVPIVLFMRLARLQAVRPASRSAFLAVSPIVVLLLAVWSLGEAVGDATGRP